MLQSFPPEGINGSTLPGERQKLPLEVWRSFADKASFDEWFFANSHLWIPDTIESIVSAVRRNGLVDPFLGNISPENIKIEGGNYRETIYFAGAKSRGRALLHLLKSIILQKGADLAVYGSEAVSEFSERLRKLFPAYVGSEYLPGVMREKFPSVRHEDVQFLSFASNSFDIVISCEVLEHIPFIDLALLETKRVLRDGGIFLGTVPFALGSATSTVKARMWDGEVQYLMEPEYHGNPVDPTVGSLVFEIPGWNLLEQMKSAGFRDAKIHFIMSSTMGIVAPGTGGILCFVAQA
jgi:SAM-dependent methyltransferase